VTAKRASAALTGAFTARSGASAKQAVTSATAMTQAATG